MEIWPQADGKESKEELPDLIRRFVGKEVIALLVLGLLVGVGVVAAELSMGFILQSMLAIFGIVSNSNLSLPSYVREWHTTTFSLAFLLLGFFRAVMYWWATYLPLKMQVSFQLRLRKFLVRWGFRGRGVSSTEVISLFNEQVTQVGHLMKTVLDLSVLSVTALGFIVALFLISAKLFIITGLFLSLLVIPIRITHRLSKRAGVGLHRDWEKINRRLVMGIRNILFLRVTAMQEDEEEGVNLGLHSHYLHFLKFAKANALETVNPPAVGIVLILILSRVVKAEEVPGPLFITFLYMLVRFLQVVALIVSRAGSIAFLKPQFSHLFDWYRTNAHIIEGETVKASARLLSAPPALRGPAGWRLRNVDFSYPGGTTQVFRDLNIEIRPGDATVIIGPSGVGKSTLLNLLVYELQPTKGVVEVNWNGTYRPLHEVESSLLPGIGCVGTESFLFEGTIYDNLIYGLKRVPSKKEMDSILQMAECQFVHNLSLGLKHTLTDQGEGLSSGQKQRLSLARALLRRPRALILDEVTSNLDSETEKRLVDTLAGLTQQFTIIAVTHRTEMLRIANQIVELSEHGMEVRPSHRHKRRMAAGG